MAGLDDFHFMATSLAGFAARDIALAAIQAGEIGILNGESAPSEAALRSALAQLHGAPRQRCGLRLDLGDATTAPGLLNDLPPSVIGVTSPLSAFHEYTFLPYYVWQSPSPATTRTA